MKKTIAISAFILLLAFGIILTRRPHTKPETVTTHQANPKARVTIGGKSLSEIQRNSQNKVVEKRMLSEQLASDYKMYQISEIEARGSSNVLVFNDGSRVHVTEFIEKQLPHHIQYRLDYSLKGGAPARHGY